MWNVVLIVAHVASPPLYHRRSCMPQGKPANTRCIQLSERNLCLIFGSPLRPKVCASLQPSPEMCLTHRDEAITGLLELELATAP